MRLSSSRILVLALLLVAGIVLVLRHLATMPMQPPPQDEGSRAATGSTTAPPPGCPTAGPELELVESKPVGTDLTASALPDTHQVWRAMIDRAERSLAIEQFYVANQPGRRLEPIVQAIEQAADRGVNVRLIADASFADKYPDTLSRLEQRAAVRRLDLTESMGGVQHGKLFIVDGCETYLGSANFDWRSLEHIHELGLRIRNPQLVAALAEVFELDWQLAGGGTPAPNHARSWDDFPIPLDGDLRARPAFSPHGWLPDNRSWDLPQLEAAIDGARRTVRVQLLTYAAHFRDGAPFPALDQALRRAARRGVTVRLITSHWQQQPDRIVDLQALVGDSAVAAKIVTIPEHPSGFIPFGRVIHAKYLVVDGATSWVGTSNWSGDYFHKSRNVGVLVDGERLAGQLEGVFDDLWNGPYGAAVDPAATYPEPRIGR